MDTVVQRALADAEPVAYWLTRTAAPEPWPAVSEHDTADLVVVGGGLTGLWAAILAKQRNPGDDVMLLEADRVASGGSGRSGGFLSESLTHGLAHGMRMWPDEVAGLASLARRNLREIEEFVRREDIRADLRLCGKTSVATEPHQVAELRDEAALHDEHGIRAIFQGAGGIRADVHSSTYRAGLRLPDSGGLVDPARLTRGLAEAAIRLGVRIHEHSPVRSIREQRDRLAVITPQGTVQAAGVVLGTSAFPAPLRRIRRYVLPLWDYALVTEPLSREQWDSLGWSEGQGITDSHYRFHYYRPTPDGRILWGGYDPVYYFGGRTGPELASRMRPHSRLARNFLHTFPQLEGVRFTHRWGGPIDSTTRLTPVFGTAFDGRLTYAIGYTGLGVGASRFGAQVALDLLGGGESEWTRWGLVRSKPTAFPPEPLRWPLVELTLRALARADVRGGKHGPWLRLLKRRGVWLGN